VPGLVCLFFSQFVAANSTNTPVVHVGAAFPLPRMHPIGQVDSAVAAPSQSYSRSASAANALVQRVAAASAGYRLGGHANGVPGSAGAHMCGASGGLRCSWAWTLTALRVSPSNRCVRLSRGRGGGCGGVEVVVAAAEHTRIYYP